MFGKSFEEKVNQAVEKVRASFPDATISATVAGKVVTLQGEAQDIGMKGRIAEEFNKHVETDNTLNQIRLRQAPAAAAQNAPGVTSAAGAARAAGGPRTHVVAKGDTLSAIAKQHYGNASKYMKIFEANRDILSDPDKIQPGQHLTIPD